MSGAFPLSSITVGEQEWDEREPLAGAAMSAFQEHGCLLLRSFFSESEIDLFHSEVEKLLALALDHCGIDVDESPAQGFDRGLDLLLERDRAYVSQLYRAVRKLPSVYAMISAPRVWSLGRQVMRTSMPGIFPEGTGIRMDHPKEERYLFRWHQDYSYNLTSDNGVTLWVPMVDVDDTNGCLRLVPGSHRLGALPVWVHDPLNERSNSADALEIKGLEAILEGSHQISVPMSEGDALVLHTFLLHRSQANRSPRTRWSMQGRYFDFQNAAAVRRGWVSGMNEGADLRSIRPDLCEDPPSDPTRARRR